MKKFLSVLIVLLVSQITQAQVTVKVGMMRQGFAFMEMNHPLDLDEGLDFYFDAPTGSSFMIPLQVGGSVGEDRNYDVGLGLNMGSMNITNNGIKTKSKIMSPNFYVEYYLINRFMPLQFGLGAAVSYSKINFEHRSEALIESTNTEKAFDSQSTWSGIGYGISLIGRYWLDEDWTNSIQFAFGNRADWRKLKSLTVNEETMDLPYEYRFDTEGYFLQLSFVHVFGEN
jgi:hypothetical protein